VDEFGNVDPTDQLFPKTELSQSESHTVSTRSFTSNLITVRPSEEIANRIYKVGTYKVRLIISGTGKDGPFESGDVSLGVQLPTVDDSWWMWTVPSFREAMWKTDHYSMSGNFINKSLSSMTASVTILEANVTTDASAGEQAAGNVMLGAPVGPGQNSAVTFTNDFAKTWVWFTQAVFTPTGDWARTYVYRVRLDITDEFKNGYPPFFTTSTVAVLVDIADKKVRACGVAASGMIAAAACLVVAAAFLVVPTWFDLAAAGAWAAAAATIAGAAQLVGLIASDPPVPDPMYRSVFKPVPISVPEFDEIKPLSTLLHTVLDIIARVEAIGQTDSRLLGAYSTRSRAAVNLQQKHFAALCHRLTELAKDAHRATPHAAEWFSNYLKKFGSAALESSAQRTMHDLKTRATLQRAFFEAGGAASDFQAVATLAIGPHLISSLSKAAPLIFALGRYAEDLAESSAASKPTAQTMPTVTTGSGRRRN
jgi:hypothetical protein